MEYVELWSKVDGFEMGFVLLICWRVLRKQANEDVTFDRDEPGNPAGRKSRFGFRCISSLSATPIKNTISHKIIQQPLPFQSLEGL